jgi:undecaprenyl-diphosphatase
MGKNWNSRKDAAKRAVSRDLRLWAMVGVAVFLFFSFLFVAREIWEATHGETEALIQLDGKILEFFAAHRTALLTRVFTDLTALGSVSVVIVLSLIVASLLFSWGDRIGLWHLLVVLLGAGALPTVLKWIFHRPRPSVVEHLVQVQDSSFPSGHSLGSAAVYLTLAFFASRHRKKLGFEVFFLGLACMIIALVGISRMYLGVHYPTDVVGGLCAGSAWALVAASIFHPFYRKAAAARSPALN